VAVSAAFASGSFGIAVDVGAGVFMSIFGIDAVPVGAGSGTTIMGIDIVPVGVEMTAGTIIVPVGVAVVPVAPAEPVGTTSIPGKPAEPIGDNMSGDGLVSVEVGDGSASAENVTDL
jgi:hypothetical protein